MLRKKYFWFALASALLLSIVLTLAVVRPGLAKDNSPDARLRVVVPEEDRFTPFAKTVHVGDKVVWVNRDTEDHSVTSDDFFNTAGHNGTDQIVPGTDSNGGEPGKFRLTFTQPGTFVYYCHFHAKLDAQHQPVAPGPEGGIQDGSNFGTPMTGVITVLP